MKLRIQSLVIFVAALSSMAVAQNSIKLFDATPIGITKSKSVRAFASKRIALSCPTGEPLRAILTGPDGGPFAVDNSVTINREWVVREGYSLFLEAPGDVRFFVGEEMESWFGLHPPVDVSGYFAGGNGTYKVELLDWGWTYGNTDLYLATNCSLGRGDADAVTDSPAAQVCHRNMGKPGLKTLDVDAAGMAAHLDHGDTAGPCSE